MSHNNTFECRLTPRLQHNVIDDDDDDDDDNDDDDNDINDDDTFFYLQTHSGFNNKTRLALSYQLKVKRENEMW